MQNQLDKSNLRQVILDFPKQFAVGLEIAKNIKLPGNFNSVVASGMGGSNLPVDIFEDYLKNTGSEKIDIVQNRNYSLPWESRQGALNFFLSYSGNTEETIACLEEAIKNNLPAVIFTHSGRMLEIAKSNKLPHVIIPECIQPRFATGYFFGALLQVLINQGLTKNVSSAIMENSKKLDEIVRQTEEQGKSLAQKMAGKTPIIYTSDKYRSVAMVVKIGINENAKTPAFYNVFPELNHNEMIGFTLPQGQFQVLTFLDKDEHPQIIKRMKITADLYREQGIETEILEISGSNFFEKIFSTLILGYWISYYLALEYGQDPTPVAMVEKFKKLL
jgi:glucose/mannose-6-phosphate isomerase